MLISQCLYCGKIWNTPRHPVNALFCEVQCTPDQPDLFRKVLEIVEGPMLRYAEKQCLLQGPTWDSPDEILLKSIERILRLANRQGFDCSKSLFGVFKKTIVRLVRDSARKAQYRRTTPGSQLFDGESDGPPFDVEDGEQTRRFLDPYEVAETNDLVMALRRHIDRLPEAHQAVVNEWLDKTRPSLPQISRKLNISYGTVRRLFSESKSMLAVQLSENISVRRRHAPVIFR